jgi:hypothetical protein
MPLTKIAIVFTIEELGELSAAAAERLALRPDTKHRVNHAVLGDAMRKLVGALTHAPLSELRRESSDPNP